MNTNNIVLILQGYAWTKEQLINDVSNYYNIDGFKNIIISTYSKYYDQELEKYGKVIKNDLLGEYKVSNDVINDSPINPNSIKGRVDFSWFKKEEIDGLNIEKWNWNNVYDYWAEKSTFKQHLTSKRGINMANKLFPNCEYYFILRADMTIHNFPYLINKWSNINMCINDDDLIKQKIILKYSEAYKKAYNIVSYFSFGHKQDICNYYNINKAITDNTFNSERIFCRSYMNTIGKHTISDEEMYNQYFYHDDEINISWYKYNKYGIYN